MTVNIALRRQLWQLDYFTEGSIPDALIGVPQGWTPDQIKQFQDYWDTEFAGDLAKRRRAKFVPGETAAKVVQTKEPQHKDDFDEWLARIICFAFSVPPQWATKAMNRATADNQSAQSEEEGLEPTKEWVKDLIDEIVAEEFASPDLELHWLDEDEGDPETVLEGRLKVGALTLNEMRDALGLDPFDNAAADRPMVLTATGYVPIEANAGQQEAGANGRGANAQSVPVVQKYSPDQPRVSAGDPEGGQWTTGDGEDGLRLGSFDAARDGSGPTARYAARDTGTRTDATTAGWTPVETVRDSGKLDAQSAANVISASEIPTDSPGHPVQFLDSAGEPITIQGNQLLRPYDRPPSMYTSEGAASHLAQYIDLYNQAVQTELSDPTEQNEQALAGLAGKIAQELAQFKHGGSLDAEQLQGQYVRDYHDYANIAIGLYLAAAGVRIEDGLRIANLYAEVMSVFHEPMDEVYTHLPRRDVRDIKMGYELYQSGRISSER